MSIILENVNEKRACDKVKYYALYNYYYLGFSKTKISKIYNKSVSTITNWIKRFEDTGEVIIQSIRLTSEFFVWLIY